MNYKELKIIGQGGFGQVIHVQSDDGKDYALKKLVIHHSMAGYAEMAKKRFIKEAIYQKFLQHPNIVKINYIDKDKNPPFYIMELADDSMQNDFDKGILNSTNFMECIYDIMAGLEEMHKYGMFHRDLKPANVLRYGKRYAIGDFGLFSLNKTGITTLTKTGTRKTSDLYTAPEITQDLKYASPQSDIYSLACILHDFVGSTQRLACHEISESSNFGDILRIATRLEPKRRFPSVASFREALNSISQKVGDIQTEKAEIIKENLEKPVEEFNKADVSALSDFLSSNIIQDEKNIIMSLISLKHIEIINKYPDYAPYIAKSLFSYVRNGSFQFDFCDTLANRVVEFMKIGSVDIVSEGIFALLYMGTNHNRWFVEGIAVTYFKGNIEHHLLERIKMECLVDGMKFCRAIDHLISSINEDIEKFNEDIQEIYYSICI
ncbi:protein kinase [Flammeovirga sp. EKP202]|uniref:serine/threonine protein kinase n=1 Tax=Flammeovirga sp. EKP202 TaxID=2770592 RepID=UPI00165FA7B6|nr:protein kinase [Flammeovirga sp. EKP202]MBD0400585.1 protein kinase [Flammeovirga sp. EKP202]